MPTLTQENRRRSPPCLFRSQEKLVLLFLRCLIMVVIMSMSLFFIGFAAIVLLHFLVISTAFHRRCQIANIAVPTAAEALRHIQTLLPGVLIRASDIPMTSDCAICLDSFQEGDVCRKIPSCKHLFHAKCVDKWIVKKPTCPVCRSRIDIRCPGSNINGGDHWKRLWSVDLEETTSY